MLLTPTLHGGYAPHRKAEAKAVERKQRAREDVERISGVRQTSVEL